LVQVSADTKRSCLDVETGASNPQEEDAAAGGRRKGERWVIAMVARSTRGGTSTSVPVVVALLPFVLPATIVAARRGFRGLVEDEQQSAPREQKQAPPEATAERSELRTKVA
jgi:hypothetical protein